MSARPLATRLQPRRLVKRAVRVLYEQVEFRIYVHDLAGVAIDSSGRQMRIDDPADITAFEPTETWHDKAAFVNQAQERLGDGEHIYTYAEAGRLLAYGWLVPVQREAYFSEVRQTFRYPEEGAVIYDVYTHPLARGRGLFHACLTEMLFDVARKENVGHAYCSVLATNAPSRHVVEKLGFRHFCSLTYSRLLWRTRKSAVPVAATV